jgi:hypothetical protein
LAILLQPIETSGKNQRVDDWVEIDLASWSTIKGDDYPHRLTLYRRLSDRIDPYFQALVIAGLYERRQIKRLAIELPLSQSPDDIQLVVLNQVKVLNYQISPANGRNTKPCEKLELAARERQ